MKFHQYVIMYALQFDIEVLITLLTICTTLINLQDLLLHNNFYNQLNTRTYLQNADELTIFNVIILQTWRSTLIIHSKPKANICKLQNVRNQINDTHGSKMYTQVGGPSSVPPSIQMLYYKQLLICCPALLHNFSDPSIILSLVLTKQSRSLRICRRVGVWITKQRLQ